MRNLRRTILLALLAAFVLPAAAPAALDVNEELEFATKLIDFTPSFADFAQKVVAKIVAEDPSQSEKTRIVEAEILIHKGDLAGAEAVIQQLGNNPAGEAASLSLALNYFQRGDMDKATSLYNAFFSRYEGSPPADELVRKRYQDAAYTYAQLLRGAGDYTGAAQNFARVEAVLDDPAQKRSMQVEAAQAFVKAAENDPGRREELLKKAADLCEKIQWGGLDLAFVDSIVVLANIELARGKPDAAETVLMDYMDVIKPIDQTLEANNLPMKDSPMAGTRSLLGRLRRERADRLANEGNDAEAVKAYSGALSEYYNVFIKYGDSPWGPDAGVAAKEIKDILESRYGKTVKIDLPSNLQRTASEQEFAMGGTLFRQKKYAESAAEYLKVLAQYPEAGEPSVNALGTLAQCYFNLDDPLYAKMTAAYLGERFGAKFPRTGDTLASLVSLYDKKGDAATARYIFDCYAKSCPTHKNVGSFLLYFAAKAERDGDKDAANAYLARILTDYQDDAAYPKALSKYAWTAYANQDYAGAVEGLKKYIEETKATPGPNSAQAMFALADCYRRSADALSGNEKLQQLSLAVKQFQTMIAELSANGNRYAQNDADKQKIAQLLENGRFYLAYSLSKLPLQKFGPPAIAKIDDFLANHPSSAQAPKALNLKGSIQMLLKDPKANETYTRLAREYPNTDEGKNAQYARISGALDLGLKDQAREAFNAMIADAGRYKVDEYVRVGQAMLDNAMWAEASRAFQQVLASGTGDEQYLQRAYFGVGKSEFELGNNEKAIENLNTLLNRWPSSGLFYDAKFMLARANTQAGDLVAAKTALNDIMRYAKNVELINDANLLYADVYLQEDDQAGALAAYKRMELLNSLDMKTERERAQIGEAIKKGIALAQKMERHEDVEESCDTFLRLFPNSPDVREIRTARDNAKRARELAAPAEPEAAPAAS
jgi:tetratricopeptide (TPR) repeat protein